MAAALTAVAAETSAATGSQAAMLTPFEADMNGDGVGDLIQIGADVGSSGVAVFSLHVFDPGDGSEVYQLAGSSGGDDAFGFAYANLGDLDGDGMDELAVGAPLAGANDSVAGRLDVINGSLGNSRWFVAGAPGDRLGITVNRIEDVSGDGLADVLVASALEDDRGRVQAYSGADGTLLWSAEGSRTDGLFGHALAGAGDASGDGVPDLIVGEPDASLQGPGRLHLLSGADGQSLGVAMSQNQTPGDAFGHTVRFMGDVTGDGVDDVLVTAPGEGTGAAYVVSAGTLASNGRIADPVPSGGFFAADAFVRPTANGLAADAFELIEFEENTDGTITTRAWVYDAQTLDFLFLMVAPDEAVIPPSSDVNADGVVSAADVALVVEALSAPADGGRADATGDANISTADLEAVVRDLGQTSAPAPASLVEDCTGLEESTGNDASLCDCSTIDGLGEIAGLDKGETECTMSPRGGGGGVPAPPPPPAPDWDGWRDCLNRSAEQARRDREAAMRWFKRESWLCVGIGVVTGAGTYLLKIFKSKWKKTSTTAAGVWFADTLRALNEKYNKIDTERNERDLQCYADHHIPLGGP